MDNPLMPIWRAEPGRWDTACAGHLLRRAGFGGTLEEIERLTALGPQRAVESLIRVNTQPEDLPAMTFGDFSGPPGRLLRDGRKIGAALTPEQRQELGRLSAGANRQKFQEMRFWWLDRMIRTRRPLVEKMTLLWHGLFVSTAATVRSAYHIHQQNQLFRKYALGNIQALTLEVSKDPAMIVYLNNQQNKKEHPNENYARELMELFTMGIGNYTEQDIKESARAFTGWSFLGDHFVFNAFEHDDGQKTFLGRTGNWDGTDIVRIIFEHPAPPRHFAKRFIRFFAMDDSVGPQWEATAEPVIAALADVIKKNNFEVAPALTALLSSKWFYSREVMRTQIKSPVQLVVGGLRSLNLNVTRPQELESSLRLMGQELLEAPNVKGWDGGRSWINTSTLFARYNLPGYLVTGRLPVAGRRLAQDDGAMGSFGDFDSGWNPQLDLAEAAASTTDAVVDLYVRKLVQDRIDPKKREELITYLNATGDARSNAFDPVEPNAIERLRGLIHLIMSMPEYQLC